MIIDHIDNIERYSRDKKLYEALNSMKTYAESGDATETVDFYMMKQEYVTKPLCEAKLENHYKYIDVHYILSGEEQILVDDIKAAQQLTDYSKAEDVELFAVTETCTSVVLKQGSFVVLYPGEGHAPRIAIRDDACRETKKIMVKIQY